MKNIVLVGLLLVTAGLLILVINFYQKSNKYSKSYEEERYSRMVAEESLQKNAAKLATLEAQLKSTNDKMERVEVLIEQEKSINGDLQKQYEVLSKIKSDLEDKLKTTVEQNVNSAVTVQPIEINNNTAANVTVEANK